MKRRKPEWLKVIVRSKIPERPLNETERLAVAMGFIKCEFTEHEKVIWCDRSKRMTQAEFSRIWPEAIAFSDQQEKNFPGCVKLTRRNLFRRTVPDWTLCVSARVGTN